MNPKERAELEVTIDSKLCGLNGRLLLVHGEACPSKLTLPFKSKNYDDIDNNRVLAVHVKDPVVHYPGNGVGLGFRI